MDFVGNSRSMKLSNCGFLISQLPSRRLCGCILLPAIAFLCIVLFVGSAFVSFDYKEKVSFSEPSKVILSTEQNLCESQSKPLGTDPLPTGIMSRTSNLEMQHLWGPPSPKKGKGNRKTPRPPLSPPSKSLLALAVGIKQKEVVNKIIQKFPTSDFTLMLFHYDGMVDEWRDLTWSDKALHVSAINQTKWWFAKRFLHPDIVAEYDYIFLWDEDLDVEHFNSSRYISIIRREGLEISQPGLDTSNSLVHYRITARIRKGDVHRRVYNGGNCNENSTGPPCTGWVEMMAPVFSRAAWRCSMAYNPGLNDLIHAWGLDMKLGYCAQGDRSKNVGVVDSEFIGHKGLPTLGADESNSTVETSSSPTESKAPPVAHSKSPLKTNRYGVRLRSYVELDIFKRRWKRAMDADKCWIDPYPEST